MAQRRAHSRACRPAAWRPSRIGRDSAVEHDRSANTICRGAGHRPGGSAGDLPDVAPPTIESGPNEAELQDLATIAKQEGITLDRAIARYAWNDNFTVALEEIRAIGGDLAEAAITEDGTAWVAFAGEVPVEAVDILARFTAAHPAVDLDVRTAAGFTETAFEDALVRVHTSVYDMPGVMEAVTSYDRPTRQIVTTVSLPSGADPDLVATLQTVSAARLADDGGRASPTC